MMDDDKMLACYLNPYCKVWEGNRYCVFIENTPERVRWVRNHNCPFPVEIVVANLEEERG